MLRAILFALAVTACGQSTSPLPTTNDAAGPAYPVDPLPPDVINSLGPGPDPEDYEGFLQLLESAEPEMVRLRRVMTPIVVKVDNLAEDRMVWTVMSFHGAMDENYSGPWFEGRWIARRVRKAWDGQSVIDWADSDHCPRLRNALAAVTILRPSGIEPPDRDSLESNGAKLTVIPERHFTLWTTWAPAYDLRFSGNDESDVGQWTIRLAIALQSCWSTVEPRRR
jgi:hypothetical protein